MATNGPNGNTPNGNIEFNNKPEVQSGIFGYNQGQNTKRQFTNDFWKEGGYLSESINELKEMVKQYEKMSEETKKLSKSEQTAFKERRRALEQQLSVLKQISTLEEASSTDAIEAINTSNKLLVSGQKNIVKVMQDIADLQGDTSQQYLDKLDKARDKYNQIKRITNETGQKLKQTTDILNKASDSFSDSLSKTLNNAGDKLSSLVNMFNIQSIANNAAEQNARSKLSIMGDVSRQFGFSSNAQFESFKNSLNDTIKDMNKEMGNLFNAEDMQQYMANLSAYGVTDTKMAEQQMKSSILATKYLGVSTETQTEIFKYMKRTNNNEVLNKQNQTIVGILKSELGVSKEQLDALSQIAYGSTEDKAAIGMTSTAIDAQNTAMQAVGAVLSDMYGDTASKSIMQSMNDFLLNPGDSRWANIFGSQYSSIYNGLYSGETKEEQTKAITDFIKGISNSQLLTTATGDGLDKAMKASQLNQISQLDSSVIASLSDFDTRASEYEDLLTTVIDNINTTTNKDVENYVEQTQEATFLESIWNWISTNLNGIPWKWTMNLANLAFTAYLASGAVNLAGKIGDFLGKGNATGGFWGGLNKFLGKGSAVATNTASAANSTASAAASSSSLLSGIVATGGGILIGTLAAKKITDAINDAQQKTYEKNVDVASSKLQGTGLEGNSVAEAALGASLTAGDENNGFFNGWGAGISSTVTGIGSSWDKIFGDVSKLNSNEYQLFLNKLIMSKGSSEDKLPYFYAWFLLADSANRLSDISNKIGEVSTDDLKTLIKSTDFNRGAVIAAANDIVNDWNKGPYKTKNERQTTIDWDKYAKNGIPWVPRDNYLINAHKGEMLLTADEAKAYRSMLMPKNAGDVREGFYSVDDGRRGGNYPYPITSAWNEARDGGRHHTGVDFGMSKGTPIGASIPGKVASASYNGGYGNLVVVQANDGKRILYAHQSRMAVKAGQQVNAGSLIGYVGSTGNSTGPHLHFEVRRTADYGTDIDPLPYVTNSLFNVGDSSGAVLSSSTDNFNEAKEGDGSVQVRTRRFVPKAFTGNMGGDDGPGRIVNSVDGGFNKLISYLDSIRDEQVKQRALLNAFSKSNIPESTF